MFQISFSGFDLLSKVESSYVKRKVRLALETLGVEKQLLTLHLCDDAEIKALNRKFRHKNKATDVLSFEQLTMPNDPFSEQLLGDIVISVETAKRQAERGGHAFSDELVVLFVHGLFHLLGYDHERGEEDARMQAEAELFVLSEIEIPVETALIGRAFYC